MATCRSRCEAACMASAGARGGPGRGRALSRSLVGSGPLQRLPYVGCMWEREPKGGRHQPKTVAGTSGDPCTFRRLSVAVAARGRDRTLEVGGSTPLGSTCDRIFSTRSTQPRTPTVRVLDCLRTERHEVLRGARVLAATHGSLAEVVAGTSTGSGARRTPSRHAGFVAGVDEVTHTTPPEVGGDD